GGPGRGGAGGRSGWTRATCLGTCRPGARSWDATPRRTRGQADSRGPRSPPLAPGGRGEKGGCCPRRGVAYPTPFPPSPGGEAAMLDVPSLRRQFPALQGLRDGRPAVFLDGPGGTQVPQRVIDAMVRYLSTCNANHGGAFATSRESDRILRAAHEAVADLLNADSADEVVF